MARDIQYYNRSDGRIEVEKIYADAAVRFFYTHPVGQKLSALIKAKSISRLYGHLQNAKMSAAKVPGFIKKFNINMNEYLPGSYSDRPIEHSYASFNEFFIRQFKANTRPFVLGAQLPAFAEARYSGVEQVSGDMTFPVKGHFLTAKDLLANDKWYPHFDSGPLLIARLCPVDYHRYHYPDDGEVIDFYSVPGGLDSVNPLALGYKNQIFIRNERRVSILQTKNFGKLAYIEVGATCVGKIVQSHPIAEPFKRAQEKGYFLFGGSTVILLGEKGLWKPSKDILDYTEKAIEVYLKLGQACGQIS